jgi:hypothetical protein
MLSVTKMSDHFTLPELSTILGTLPYEHNINSLILEKYSLTDQQKPAPYVPDSRKLHCEKHESGLEIYEEIFHQSKLAPGMSSTKDLPLTYEQAKAEFSVSSQDAL